MISIHAPTNGATAHNYYLGGMKDISIHAPTNGATVNAGAKVPNEMISIHAPTNGATAILHKKNLKNYTKPLNNIIIFYN